MMYRTVLTLAGYAVIAVEDGVDALRQFEWNEPDAVVLDLGLPRLGGRDVQREMASHRQTQTVPIVVVTGSDTTDLIESDFACIMRKPINPQSLVDAVRRCLNKH